MFVFAFMEQLFCVLYCWSLKVTIVIDGECPMWWHWLYYLYYLCVTAMACVLKYYLNVWVCLEELYYYKSFNWDQEKISSTKILDQELQVRNQGFKWLAFSRLASWRSSSERNELSQTAKFVFCNLKKGSKENKNFRVKLRVWHWPDRLILS